MKNFKKQLARDILAALDQNKLQPYEYVISFPIRLANGQIIHDTWIINLN